MQLEDFDIEMRGCETHYQIAGDDLKDLCAQTRAVLEHPLQDMNEKMAERCADKGPVCCHFDDSGAEVVTVFAAVMGEPGGDQFLQSCQCPRRKHLRSQRI